MRRRFLGVPVDLLRYSEAVESVLAWVETRESRTAHFCDVHLLVTAHDERAVGETLDAGTLNATDGVPLVWLARLLGHRAERVCGPDLMLTVMDRGRTREARHYLYGGTPEVVERLERRLTTMFPGLLIVGTWSPPFTAQTEADLEADLKRIEAPSPDFVWVGLGAPKQDLWVEAARRRLHVAGLMAVGAAFDIHSGNTRRAPAWMQRTGTEWLFRLASEPRRLWRRYMISNARFACLAARQLVATLVRERTR